MKMRIFVIIFVIGVFIACAKKETGIKNDVKLRIEEYKKIAINSYRKGNTENAINFLNQSLEMAYNVDSVENIVEINNLMGDIYMETGELFLASNCIFNAHNIETMEKKEISFSTSLNVAKLWIKFYEKTKSNTYIEKSKEAFVIAEKSIKNEEDRAKFLNSYGKLMIKMKDYDAALDYFFKALKLNKARKNYSQMADNYYNIGRVYEEEKFYEKALENYKASLTYDKLVENIAGIFFDLKKIGISYRKLGNERLAEHYLSKARKIAYNLNNKALIEEIEKIEK